jgi:hypothetical protein
MLVLIVGSGFIYLFALAVIGLYKLYQKKKYGPIKDIGFEGTRFRVMSYLSDKATTVNRLSVIEDLEINVPDFKQVVNSLTRDKLISTGPQSIKLTRFGQQYHDVFVKKEWEDHGSKTRSSK